MPYVLMYLCVLFQRKLSRKIYAPVVMVAAVKKMRRYYISACRLHFSI